MSSSGRARRFGAPCVVAALAAVAACVAPPPARAAGAVAWVAVRADLVDQLNADLRADAPTADVGIYYPSNLDASFAAQLRVEDLVLEFATAKRVFRAAGVELRLLWIKSGRVDPRFLEIQANDASRSTPGARHVNMYEDTLREPTELSAEAREAFESIVEKSASNDRTVYLVVLQDVFMSFFEKLDERTWELRTISTGGLSFPSYSYHRTIPRRLRGVITVNKTEPFRRLVAHELGHKLMNVSHEYRERGPEHEIRAEGGLMLYGQGTEIPNGAEGRWHRERLLLSPYLYRLGPAGRKIWNADYREDGHYYDPLYGDYAVRFGR
jgi:hypothetical protein